MTLGVLQYQPSVRLLLSHDDIVAALSVSTPHVHPGLESLDAVVQHPSHFIQIGKITEARATSFNYHGDPDRQIDIICSCGWEADDFKKTLQEAIYSAMLHQEAPEKSEYDLLDEYGYYGEDDE
jgi:hypothetical protein